VIGQKFSRRRFLASIGAAATLAANGRILARGSTSPGLAITIDDFDLTSTPLLSGEDRDATICATLKRHRIKAAGFVAGKYVDPDIAPRVLRRWSDDGHIIGNHSFSHGYFSGSDPAAFMADVLRCEPLLSRLAGFQKLFRFPYLAEGKTAEGRDNMRMLLKANGYRNAHVTIDTSDWYIDNRLRARLKVDATADLAPYRRFYLDHLWDRATYYDGLARMLFGRSIDHTILLHHRLTTALFLDEALEMFRARGWRIIDSDVAFRSTTFALEPEALPAGQSLIWALNKANPKLAPDLRYPGEDGDYEAAKMDALKL
jgi:peptidoglycan/xylan/chitin deacetylase (PgdA/CDA1 family)